MRARAAPHLPSVDGRAVFRILRQRSLRAMADEFEDLIRYP
jgi:hypothetical protein